MNSDRFYFRRFFRKARARPQTRKRLLETLEDRILYDAVAAVTIAAPPTVNLGENLPVVVTFQNGDATDTGYGPWIDVAIDRTGADGLAPGTDPADLYDGFTLAAPPTYLGTALTHHVLILDDAANGGLGVVHPFAVNDQGQAVYVSTTDPDSPFFALLDGRYQDGDILLVIELPFGSFTPDQPAAEVRFSLELSELADIGAALPLSAWGGFRFGNDSLNNPIDDPVIYGAAVHLNPGVGATLATLEKTFNGPENETATGINYLRTYRINVDIAAGQTLDDLHIFDDLPDQIQFVAISGSSHAYTVLEEPDLDTPGGRLAVRFNAPVDGTGAAVDAWIEIQFYVPRLDANGDPVLNPATGLATLVQNQAYGFGSWDPVDDRDDPVIVGFNLDIGVFDDTDAVTALATAAPDVAFERTFTARSLAVQKSVALAVDTGGAGITPGDTLEYTIDFQVSDYFALGSIVVTDVFSDGQELEGAIQLEINGNTFSLALDTFDPANYTVSARDPVSGEVTITLDISAEIIRRGGPAFLLGGGIDPNNPNAAMAGDLADYDNGATTGRIIFRTKILDSFEFAHLQPGQSGEASLNSRDELTNGVDIEAEVLTIAAGFAGTGNIVTDGSGDSVTIVEGIVEKTIYAINGMLLSDPGFNALYRNPDGSFIIKPGDAVTYRITYTVPSGDLEGFRITDYLPLPVFSATEIDIVFDGTVSANAPAAGTAKYGPTHTMHNIPGPGSSLGDPTIVRNAGSNYVDFIFGDSADPGNVPRVVDLLFTTTVSSEPFADGLFLTNQAVASESSTQNPATASASQAIIQVILSQPKVDIYKGVVASTKGGSAGTVGGLTFATTAGNGFTGTLAGGAADIGDLDLTDDPLPDAGDIVRFALVVQNTGRSGAFDVTVADTIRDSYVNNYADAAAFAAATNFRVYDGDGNQLTLGADYLLTWDNGTKVFTVELVDVGGDAALGRGFNANTNTDITDGSNGAVILYDLTVAVAAEASSTVNNTAELRRYAGADGATNHVGATPWTDDAEIVIAAPQLHKNLLGTGVVETGNSATQAVIGEEVYYEIVITLSEGTTGAVVLTDTLDNGLAFVAFTDLVVSAGLTTASGLDSVSGLAALNTGIGNWITVTGDGRVIEFDFGDIINTDTSNGTTETITIRYTAVVLNLAGNQAGTALNNAVELAYEWADDPDGGSGSATITASSDNVTVIEPTVVVSNQLSDDQVDWVDNGTLTAGAGQTIYYRVIIENTGTVWAHDISLYDRLPNVFNIGATTITSVTSTNGSTEFDMGSFVIGTDTAFGVNKPVLATSGTLASLAPGERVTIIVESRVVDNAVAASTHPNGIQVRWTSLNDGVRSTDAVDTTPTGYIFAGDHTPIVLSAYNANAVERTGADGPNGALNDYAATDDLTATVLEIEPITLIKQMLGTEIDGPGNADDEAVIGEYVDYSISFAIPKGLTQDFVLTDVLQTGLAFVEFLSVTVGEDITTNVDGDNASTGDSLIHAGGDPTDATNLARLLANTTVTLDGAHLVINFGDIFNAEVPAAEGDYVPPQQITITYRALVTNIVGNVSGATRNNTATIAYITTADSVPTPVTESDTSPSITIIEPVLTIDKTVTSTPPYDAGDVVQYTIVIGHDADSETHAYDLTFSDLLPDYLVAATSGVVFVTADIGGDINITRSALGDLNAHFEIVFDGGSYYLRTTAAAEAAGAVDLQLGETITIVVNARLDLEVPPTLEINNTATVTWTSMDGAPSVDSPYNTDDTERGGAGGGANNYSASDSADFTISGPAIDKQWKDGTLTADDTSVDSSLLGNVVIGEQLTYDILVTLTNGTTGNLSIADLLPPGLRMDGYRIITAAADTDLLALDFDGDLGVAYALDSDVAVVQAPGVGFTWNFGDVTTNFGASETDANRFVIRVTATVANLLANQQNVGITLPAATLTFDNPNPGPATTTVNDLVAGNNPFFTVVEPTLGIAKTVDHGPDLDAGDEVEYTIVITNTSGQTAYDLTFSDELSDQLTNFGNLSVTHSAAGPITGFFEIVNDGGTFYLRTTAAAEAAGSVDLADGQTITVIFTADIIATIGVSVDIENTAAVRWTSTDGTGHDQERTGAGIAAGSEPTTLDQTSQAAPLNNYALSSSVITAVTTSVTAVKSLVPNGSDPNTDGQVTPGEVVTYSITVTLPEGQAPGFTILDLIPPGMQYVTGSFVLGAVASGVNFTVPPTNAIVGGGPFGDGTDVLFQFGEITVDATPGTANNTFTFTYQAVALDNVNVDGLLPGQSQHNNAAAHNNGSGTTYSHSAGFVPLTAVEPQLTIGKSWATTPVQAGDVFAFDLTLTNTGTGTAFDINLIDQLAAQYNLANIADITIQTQPAGAYVTIDANDSGTGAGALVDVTLNELRAGHTVVIRITGTVSYTAQVAQTINNIASVVYSTLPGNVAGERTYDPVNSLVVAFTMPDTISVKTVVATSEAHTGTDGAIELLAIGEIIRYRLAVTIPQGTAGNLVLTDILPAGLQYLAGSATIAYDSDAAFTTTVPAGALTDGVHVTLAGQTLTFNLGAVTNNDADAGVERIFVEFNALILNSAANNAGDAKANQFTASVNGGATVNSTSGIVTARIVEPRVTVGKTANRTEVDGGDLITYTVTLTNTGGANGADAFNVILADILPAGLTLVGGVTYESGVDVTGSLVATAGADTLTTAAGGFTLEHGQTAVFTYQVLVGNTVQHGADLENQVDITWTSLPGAGTTPNATNGTTPGASGAADGERGGTGGGQNDYADSDSVSIEVELLYAFEKTIAATSLADTGSGQGNPALEDLAIGEEVTYELVVTLGEGTTSGVIITDLLPAGLDYVSSTIVSIGGNTTAGATTGGNIAAASGGLQVGGAGSLAGSTLTFNFGNVAVNGVDGASASAAATRQIVIRVTARAADVPGNQSGTVLTNTAEFASGAHAVPLSDAVQAEIVTPALTIEKRWATTPVQAGDTFAFDIELVNTGTATAFDINLIDQLAAQYNLANIADITIQTQPAGAYVTIDANDSGTGAGALVDVTLNELRAGHTVVIRITGTVNATAAVSHEIENVASVVYSTLPGSVLGERVYDPVESLVVAFTMPATTTVKTIVGTSETHTVGSDVAIGEIVRYRIVVTVPQGTAKNLTIVDVLPAGLEFVNDGTATLQFVADNPFTAAGVLTDAHNQTIFLPAGFIDVAGQTISFGLGDVVNHDNDVDVEQVVIEFNARVLNVPGNVAGGTPANNVTTRVEDEVGDLVSNSSAAPVSVTIVEPAVALTKAVVPGSYDAGDLVTYTFTLTNTGTATGFDLRVIDDLPAAFAAINSVAITAGPGVLTNNSSGTDLDFVINQLAEGATVTVTVTATLAATTAPGLLVENTAALTYTSLPGTGTGLEVTAYDTVAGAPDTLTSTPGAAGATGGERTGAGGDNNYHDSDGADFTVLTTLTLAKSIVTTSLGADTSLDVVIGEVITYRLNVTLQQGETSVVTLNDTLDLGLGYLGATAFFRSADGVTALGATSGILYGNGSIINAADLAWNAATGAFEVRLSNVIVPATAANGTGAFQIEYDARVHNVVGNQNTTQLDNGATVSADRNGDGDHGDAGETSVPAGIIVTVIEPVLTLVKTTITPGADGGDTVVYELEIENTGNATAYDILISDILDGSLRLDPANLATALAIHAGGSAGSVLNQGGNTADEVATVLNWLEAGDTITIRITAEVRAGAVAGATVANSATVSYTSLPGADANERTGVDGDPLNDYIVTAASPTTFTLATPTLDKALVNTSEAHTLGTDVTVGEVLTFDLLVTLPEGVTLDLVVTDLLPPGLAYVGHSIITLAAGSTLLTADYAGTVTVPTVTAATVSGQDVIFDFGDITTDSDNDAANNSFVIRVQVVVVNEAGNVDGTNLTNDAGLVYTHGTTGDPTPVASANDQTVVVVEPRLEVAKTITSDVTNLDAGDTVTYEIRVRHTAGVSTADAFDVVITDQLPAELRDYALVSATIGATNVSGALTLDPLTGALGTTGVIDLAEGEELVITLSGVVRDNTTVGTTITNEAFLYWSSLAGGQRGDQAGISGAANDERTGVGGGANTYAGDDDVSATTRGHLAITKSADRAEATIGEIITYTLTVTVAEGRTVVNFTDTLPANTALVANSVQVGANLANLVITGLNANSVTGQTITVETNHATGTVANDGAVAQNATFTITYQVRVLDEAANSGLPGGQTDLDNSVVATADLNNDGDETDPNEEATDNETVVVVEPQLVVTKTAGDADRLITPGSTVTYTVDTENRGTAAAHNVVITDTIDAGVLSALANLSVVRVDLSDSSTTALTAGVDYTVTSGLTGWEITLTAALAEDFGIRVTYDATYVNTLVAGTNLDNNARVTFTSLANPGDADVRSYVPVGTEIHDHVDATTPDAWQDTERVSVGTGSVSDYVWFDLNGDGVQDANEAGIAGVRVWIDMDGDGVFNAAHDLSAVTDSSGNYLITGLAPGDYTVRVDFSTLPGAGAGIVVTYDLDDGITTPDGLTVVTVTAVNPTGDAMTDVDFGFRGTGSLGDFVWLDLDGDGTVSGLEKGIEGVILELRWDVDGDGYADANNPVIATTTTDAGGLYSFGNLLAGGYRVVVAAANFIPGGVLEDAAATYDRDGGNVTPTGVSTTTLGTNAATDTTLDFGYRGAAAIGDRVWNDFNGDGVQDADEFGISGLTLQLEQFIGGVWVAIATATTGMNGAYDFSGLIADDYRVTVVTPPANAAMTSVDTPDVTFDPGAHQAVRAVGSAEQADDMDFGYEGQASIAGIVWFDQNADGSQVSDPPLHNVRVSIVVDGVTTEILTDATGYYEFTGLIAGTYTVVVDPNTLPPGLRLPTYDRDDGLVDPDGEAVVTVASTEAVADAHFGFQGEYFISGHSYRDTDKSGGRNAGDTGIGGVLIELIWDNNGDGVFDLADGDLIITSVLTDADGYYEFTDLIIGDYLIRETQPAGFGQAENGDLIAVVVDQAADNSARNFGNTTGSLAGTVFRDDNNDGAQAVGEDGLAGVTLYLDLWDAVLGAYVEIGTTVTDASGNYLFDHANTDFTLVSGLNFGATTGGLLSSGEYRLREDQPAGYLDGADTAGNAAVAAGNVAGTHQGRDGSDAIAGIRIDPGQDIFGYTFAELLPSSLSGYVYLDHNGDGLFNLWESGLEGVTITLTGVNDIGEVIEVGVVTDAAGYYEFTDLRPSDGNGYTLTQRTQPAGYSDGVDNLGGFAAGSGNTAGDDTVANEFSGILVVDLSPGANEGVNYNFGETFDFVLNKQVVGTSLGSSAGSEVVVGEVIRYRLTVNVPYGTLADFQLHDHLPAGLRFLDDGTATTALSANLAAAPLAVSSSPTAADANYGSGTDVYFKLGTVTNTNPADNGGETITIEFNAVVVNEVANAAGAGLTNAFTVRFDTTGDNVADDTPVMSPPETVTVIEPALTLVKSADDTTPHLGQTVVYTIDIFNEALAHSATAYDLVVTDVLPPLVVTALGNITVTLHDMAGTAGTGDDIALGVLTAGVDYTVVSTLEGWTITFSELAPDHRIEIAYEVVIATIPTDVLGVAGLFGGGDDAFDNTVTLDWSSLPSGHPDEPGERDYTTDDTLTTTVVGADLELIKNGPATIEPGDIFAYVFTITNHGTDTATGVVLTDLLPGQVTFVSALGSDAAVYVPAISTIDGQQQVVFALPDLAVGDTFELTVSVTFAPVANAAYEAMVNSARVTHDDIDPTSPDVANPPYDDNVDAHPTTVVAVPGVGVAKQMTSVNNGAVPLDEFGRPIVTAGDTVIYTIVLTNTGNQNTLVTVVDTFPMAVLDLANAAIDDSQTGVAAVIDLDAGTITWTGIALEVGRPITITIEAAAFNPQLAGIDDFNNTVLVTTSNPENPSETGLTAEDGATAQLDAAPDLVVTKVNSTDVVDLVDPFTYTITVANHGDQDATDVTVVDILSPFVEFVGASGNYVYDAQARTVTWSSADNPELRLLAGGGAETHTFTVTTRLSLGAISFDPLVNTVRVFDDGLNGPDRNPADNEAQTATEVMAYLYDGFRNFARVTAQADDDWYHLGLPIEVYRDAILPIAPIYSGAAEPGSTLEIALYNAEGHVIGHQTVVVDAGGNWMASFPGVILKDYPQSVVITQTLPYAQTDGSAGGYNLRPYYATAINAGQFFRESLNVTRLSEQTAERSGADLQAALLNPIGFGVGTAAYEALASPGQPTGR